ncbi:hypothetical protein ACO0KY_15560 [Undibacterium sp. Dicai25W]|uniref:hypothetical protein n=1 Tax=Undibacterium sp. Dicai25W TaxID=3413034 RepID=UPI003BF1BC48
MSDSGERRTAVFVKLTLFGLSGTDMRSSDLFRLFSLAAIWGASFLFMRIIAPVLGAFWTAEIRVGLADLALIAWMLVSKQPIVFRQY